MIPLNKLLQFSFNCLSVIILFTLVCTSTSIEERKHSMLFCVFLLFFLASFINHFHLFFLSFYWNYNILLITCQAFFCPGEELPTFPKSYAMLQQNAKPVLFWKPLCVILFMIFYRLDFNNFVIVKSMSVIVKEDDFYFLAVCKSNAFIFPNLAAGIFNIPYIPLVAQHRSLHAICRFDISSQAHHTDKNSHDNCATDKTCDKSSHHLFYTPLFIW